MRHTQLRTLALLATMSAAGCGAESEPFAVNLSTPEDTALPLSLIPTHPVDGTPTYTVTGQPQHGTLEGTFPTAVYMPEADYNGADTVAVRVKDDSGTTELTLNITVGAVNDPPKAIADVVAGTEDTAQMIVGNTLVQNDLDIDGDTLTVTGVGQVRFGTASIVDGNILFTPTANFNGSATLLYSVSDGTATASGVVTISVGLVNDAPVANDDFLSTDEDTALVIDDPYMLTGNDTDIDNQNLAVTAVSNVTHGTATIANGTITFTPAANYNGDATFVYTVSDGALTSTATATVTVNPVNDAPVAKNDAQTATKNTPKQIPVATLLANDTDADGDALTLSAVSNAVNGTAVINGANVIFTPTNNFTGAARFDYTISDGTVTSTAARVTVTVN